jgi:hypothetical protein
MAVKKFSKSSFKIDTRYQSLLAGNTSADYSFIAILGNSATEVGYGVGLDSNRNAYISFRSNSSGSYRCSFAKYSKNGGLVWQKQVNFNNHPAYYENDLTVDSSGNIYGLTTTTDGTNGGGVVTKYTTDGAVTWQQAVGTSYDSFISQIATDSSANVYFTGPINNTSSYSNTVVKYNSSGTVQWKKYLNGAALGEGSGVATDSSGNIYGGGFGGAGLYGITNAKFNTSGTLQWLKKFNGPGSTYDAYGGRLTLDSSTNSYQIGTLRAAPTVYQAFLIKRDSSGTLQWQRKISNSGSSYGFVPVDVTTDSSSNIYTTNYTLISSVTTAIVAKWDSSGTLQWQRSISGSGGVTVGRIKVDSSGYMWIVATTNVAGNSDVMLLKLPSDGSLTGTYTVGSWSITYAASSLTEAAGDGVESSSTYTAADNGVNDSTPSNSIANSSFTSTVLTI